MNEIKSWFTSKTIIAAAVGVLLTVLQALHVSWASAIVPADVADNVVNVANAVLFVIAIFGRVTATTKIGSTTST